MNTSALILMIAVQTLVTAFTVYFFWKVMKTKPKPGPDSYHEDEEE